MNTIPLTFDGWEIPYSVIGGTAGASPDSKLPLSVVLLNRGGKYYRASVLQAFADAGFSSVISVENTSAPYDVETLVPRFPFVKFLIPQRKLSVGEMINAGIAACESKFVLVLWNDQHIHSAENIRTVLKNGGESLFCFAPFLSGRKFDPLPVQFAPSLNKKQFQIQPLPCLKEGEPTIYPFDFTGIYDREKFIDVGGFDSSIPNPYWQNADLGFRVHLWGGEIRIFHQLKISYESEIPAENVTTDLSYLSFYLKNLAPVLKGRGVVLPFRRFFSFAAKSGMNVFDSWSYFRGAAQWITINGMRFMKDANSLISAWEPAGL